MSEAVETGWLVEHAKSPVSKPLYVMLSSSRLQAVDWTEDHLRAIRFARKQDATAFAHQFVGLEDARICDHQWVSA